MDVRISTLLREIASKEAVSLRPRGACMAPVLRESEAVPVRARRVYLPGDVVVFRTPAGDLAMHRVLGFRPTGLVTKGDACDVHDAPVRAEDIIGAADVSVSMRDRGRALASLAQILWRRLRR